MSDAELSPINESWRGIIKWGGLSLFLAAAVLVVFVVFVAVSGQTLPVPAQEALDDPTRPTRLFAFAAVGEFLLMPGALALFFALRGVNHAWSLIGAASWCVAVPMFLASRGLILALAPLSAIYLGTTDTAMRASVLASAQLALEAQNSYATMALLLLSAGSIVLGAVMMRGVLGKYLGLLAIVAGALSIFSPFAVMMHLPLVISFAGLALSSVWQLIAGIQLFRIGSAG